MKHSIILFVSLLFSCTLFAQEYQPETSAPSRKKPKTAIAGTIKNARKIPMQSIKVFVYKGETDIVSSGYTNEKGYYETSSFQPGEYTVKVIYPSFRRLVITRVPVSYHKVTPLYLTLNEPLEDSTFIYSDIAPTRAYTRR